jgi:hypothetical protein
MGGRQAAHAPQNRLQPQVSDAAAFIWCCVVMLVNCHKDPARVVADRGCYASLQDFSVEPQSLTMLLGKR